MCMSLDLDIHLLIGMLKEEWRLHRSLSGGLGSTFFPLIIFSMTALCVLTTPFILNNLPRMTIILILHVSALLYGVFVGGFGAIGEQIMTRRLGQVNMLLQLPQTYPLTFKKMMAVFYIKDAIFYLIYTFIPMILGIGVVGTFYGYSLPGVLRIGTTTFLTFLLGMGLSFVISALAARSKMFGIIASLWLLGLVALVWPLGILQPHQIILPLGYWVDRSWIWPLTAAAIAIGIAAVGTLLMRERFEAKQKSYTDSFLSIEDRFKQFGNLQPLIAKEWLELTRSSSLAPIIGSYTLNLVAVYSVSWIFENGFGIPLGFNVVFFSALVGFMGVSTYSSLTSLEHNEFLNVMPVSVDSLVRAKLVIYFLITSGVATAYVVAIGFMKGEMILILPSLIIAACNSIFVAAVTAYLTGLWTNTMFFGAKTILKFTLMIVPLLALIEMGTLTLPYRLEFATPIIIMASAVELLASAFLFRRLSRKWRRASFSYISTGV
jgi:hypothetical protein